MLVGKDRDLIERIKKRDQGQFLYDFDSPQANAVFTEGSILVKKPGLNELFALPVIAIAVYSILISVFSTQNISWNAFPFFISLFFIIAANTIWWRLKNVKKQDRDIEAISRDGLSGVVDHFPPINTYDDLIGKTYFDKRSDDINRLKKMLEEALEEGARPVILTAASGMGKTILLKTMKDSFEKSGDITCPIIIYNYKIDTLSEDFKNTYSIEDDDIEKTDAFADIREFHRIGHEITKNYSGKDSKCCIVFDQFEKILYEPDQVQKTIAEFISLLSGTNSFSVLISIRGDKFHEIFTNDNFKTVTDGKPNAGIVTISKIKYSSYYAHLGKLEHDLELKAIEVLENSRTSIEHTILLRFLAQENEAKTKKSQSPYTLEYLKESDFKTLIECFFERLLCEKGRYLEASQVLYLIAKYYIITGQNIKIGDIKSAICTYRPDTAVDGTLELLKREGLIICDEKKDGTVRISHDLVADRYISYVESKCTMGNDIKTVLDQYCSSLKDGQIHDTSGEKNKYSESRQKAHLEYINHYKDTGRLFWIPFIIAAVSYLFISLLYPQAAEIHSEISVDVLDTNKISFSVFYQVLIMFVPLIMVLAYLYSWVMYANVFSAAKGIGTKNWCSFAFFFPPIAFPCFLFIWLRFWAGSTLIEMLGLASLVIIIFPSIWIEKALLPKLYQQNIISQDAKDRILHHSTRYRNPIIMGSIIVFGLYLIINNDIFWQIASIVIVLLITFSFIYLLRSQSKRSYCMQLFMPLTAIWGAS